MKKEKIFCIGLSRTGTTSIHHFLEQAGYKSIHFPLSLFIHPEVISNNYKFRFKIAKSSYSKWRAGKEIKAINESTPAANLFNEHDAFSDLPVPLYFKELAVKFPDSKFIYTTRSVSNWLKSMEWMFREGKVLWNWGYITDEILYEIYGTKTYDKKKLEKVFEEHEKEVMNFFEDKKDRLLFINIEDKVPFLERLCAFLNISYNGKEFPRSNEKVEVGKIRKIGYLLSRRIPFFFLLHRFMVKN